MKKVLYFLLFAFSFSFGQMKEFPLKSEDLSIFLTNYGTPFHGEISTDKTVIQVKIEKAVKNPNMEEQYFISGYSDVEGNKSNFSGEVTFTQRYNVNGAPDDILVFQILQ